MQEQRRRTDAIAVLGMHRSGTSCLTGLLEDAGVWLGAVSKDNPHNKKGNQENFLIMHLHDRVLSDNGATWDHPPDADCIWSNERLKSLGEIIDTYPSDRTWAFKDPRTCFTISAWKEQVPKLRFLGTYRHPTSVAASLNARSPGISMRDGNALWCRYNKKLLELHDTYDFPLICFDLLPMEYLEKVQSVFETIGLNLPAPEHGFFEPKLRHHCSDITGFLTDQAEDIYTALTARAV